MRAKVELLQRHGLQGHDGAALFGGVVDVAHESLTIDLHAGEVGKGHIRLGI